MPRFPREYEQEDSRDKGTDAGEEERRHKLNPMFIDGPAHTPNDD